MAQRTFLGQLKETQEKLEQLQPAILEEAVSYLVSNSPDDTGAYVLSHSVGRSGNVGRSISSHGRLSAPGTHKQEAWANMMDQVETIPPTSTRVWMGNNSPHVNVVEYGGANWKRGGYYVYTKLRNVFPSIIQSAKSRVGLK